MIHADAIAGLSTALKSLLQNESFVEANNKRVVWDDVEVDTFLRFTQYAYIGNYEEPPGVPSVLKDEGSEAQAAETWEKPDVDDEDLELEDDIIWPQFTRRQAGKGRAWRCTDCKTMFYDSEMNNGCPRCPSQFYSRYYGTTVQETRFQSAGVQLETSREKGEEMLSFAQDPSPSNVRTHTLRTSTLSEKACGPLQDGEAVEVVFKTDADKTLDGWLAISEHAKLYVLGDKWGIDRLKGLALRKMQMRLEHVSIDEEGILALFDLVRFAYVNTASSKDMFRGLITHFMAAEILTENMGRRKGFSQLLEDIPDFAKAIWGISYRLRIV